jgi:hypothetical protein
MWFRSVSEAENQKDHMEAIALEGFLHIQASEVFTNSSRHSGR